MQSILFFPLFLIYCSLFTFVGNKYKNYTKNLLIIIFISIFVFILGVRVNFGTDQETYLHMYFYQGADLLRCEKLYVLINQFLRLLDAPYQLLFALIAFLEIYFLVLTFEKENVNVFWGFILFFLIYINLYLNLSRQAIAMSFILFSIYFFSKKKYLSWIIISLIATGFHVSSVLSIFLIPVLNITKKIKIPKFIYYLIICILILFFDRLFDLIIDVFLMPLSLVFGEKLKIVTKVLDRKIPLGSGMGVRLRGIAYMCLLPLLLDYKNQNEKNNLYFTIFYFGLVGEFLSSVNMNLTRVFYYYSLLHLIILPTVLININRKNLKKLKIKEILFLMGLFFIFVLAVPKWINGSDTTEFYRISLNFDLFSNHSF